MICILSQAFLEPTTEAVMDWLHAWGVPYVRINGSDIDHPSGPKISISTKEIKLQINIDGVLINPSEIEVVWFRRWAYNNRHRKIDLFKNELHHSDMNLFMSYHHVYQELQTVSTFLFSRLAHAVWLGDPKTSSPNKLQMMQSAIEVGLDVPDTLITTDINEVRAFAQKHGHVVTKPLSDMLLCVFDDVVFASYTSIVPEEFLCEGAWSGSFPSLFQEKLEKKYEIRTFYLDGQFYSMAMFSQHIPITQVDFRRYDYENQARTVPYQLPAGIEDKLHILMKTLDLKTGSIDIIRTVDGRYVFLEVNPNGQFGMVSEPCNYFLEKKVARYLADNFYDSTRQPNQVFC
jgi:ATP-GRASP peptide maturase of grasp-with-spasm system